MTLLSQCQAIANDAPVAAPASIISNSDTPAQLLLACMQRAGASLAAYKSGGWAAMMREYTFPTVAIATTGIIAPGSAVITGIPSTAAITAVLFGASGTGILANAVVKTVDSGSQVTLDQPVSASATAGAVAIVFGQLAYALPADFNRTITDTEWDRSRRWPLVGPRSPQQWQLYKSGLIGSATFQRRWRIKALVVAGVVGKYFVLDPTPTDNGSVIVFEYVANSWCQSAGGVAQTQWQFDSDTGLLDENLIGLEARWRFLNRLGLAYAAERDEAETEIAKAFANDGGMPILSVAPRNTGTLIGPQNIPDTGFGGVVG
jgi:hypothetical protein